MDLSIIISAVIALAAGLMVGWLATKARADQIRADLIEERRELDIELSAARQQLVQEAHWREECELLNNELRSLRDINTSLEADLREVTTRLESTQLHAEDKIRQMVNSEQRLSEQFENLANRIFEHSNRRVDEQNRLSLHGLLTPLREQLDGFRRQVQESFGQEARERHTLAHEIRNLQQLNAQMAQEALNLTKALKGDNKTQGNWGEVVLTRVLEASGLREGYEYQTQVSIETDNRSRMQPDVIVRLPQGKDVVIDAKMTLVAYERYFNAEDDYTREVALQEHLASVRNHIRLLGRKDYQQLPGLRSLDYVLMFIPVEPAFLVAIDRQPELISEALQNNIMLVSPTTLLVALRTIANLWRYEHQSRNAQKIAERAGRLYDKMRLFVDDMSAIGQSLDKAQENYRQAMKKLASGRGNLLAQAEAFRGLGVEVKRGINPDLVEQATAQDDEYRLEDEDNLPENDAFSADSARRYIIGRRLRHVETYGKCAESDTLSEHFLEKQAGIEMVEDSQETTHFGFQTVAKEQKQDMVAHVFHSVAAKYDVMNDLMSFGIHRLWKRFTIDCSGVRRGQTVLDLAGGTGDLTAKFSRLVGETGRVMLADINDSMLKMGREKLRNIGIVGNVEYVQANAEALPFADNTFDCITISFGLRNVTDKEKALRSMYRVLKPGGRLLVLEFSKPIIEPLSKAYDAYSFHILPKVGELVAKDGDSYRYLAESIRMHPDQENPERDDAGCRF
ncbi:DNA recombination protein RmuC [Klebsiella variicola]|uniref:Ubiquinone/menaquinone biosynthesis C-methyltransferase UbiE n=19 Tax=Gammaproteobacteria TaxID=1236 RepID=A0A7H4MB04_KLEVA|nr:DNA recombination protein RmuC [Klebsiella variicola]